MAGEAKLSREIGQRWTPKLVERGFVPIADSFLANYSRLNPPITHSEAMFIIHVFRYKWDASAPYPGFKAVAKMMGISAAAARGYARNLEQKKYLIREMRIGATNRFHFERLFAALETLILKDEERRDHPEPEAPASPEVIAIASRPLKRKKSRQA